MRPGFGTLLYLSVLALASGSLYLLLRDGRAQLDREVLSDPWLLVAQDQPGAEEIRGANRRAAVKCQVIEALLDGRLTFPQAAARFRDLNARQPDGVRNWRPPWYSEEEWPYRQVIIYVYAELTSHRRAPAQEEEWVARLEAELREHLRHGGAPRPAGGPERVP
jgi:hypothetical protein